jgi:hypothetical protein
MNRRHLLQLGSAAAASPPASPAGCSPRRPAGPRFLLVFLRGGYDSTNLLIPYSSSFYYEARPNIAIPGRMPASNTGALALNADWALAPAVRDTIGAMYQQRQVRSSRSPAPTICRAATSRPRTASSWPADRRRAQLPLRLSRPALRHADGAVSGRAHRVHRRAAAGVRGRPPCRTCRSRTSASRPSMSARRASERHVRRHHLQPRSATAWSCARKWRRRWPTR